MNATVQQSTREGRSSDAERQRQLDQLTSFANQASAITAEITTEATAADTAIWTSNGGIQSDSTILFQAKVTGKSADGSVYGFFEYAAAIARGSGGANATQLGATQEKMVPIRSDAGITCALTVTNNQLVVTVNDGGLGSLDWKAWIEVRLQ